MNSVRSARLQAHRMGLALLAWHRNYKITICPQNGLQAALQMSYSSYYASCRQIERWYLLTSYIQMAIVLKTDRSTTCSRFPVAQLRIRNANMSPSRPFLRIIGYSSWRRVNAAEYFILVGHTTQEGVRLVQYNSDWLKKCQIAVFNQSEAGNETPAFWKFAMWRGRASRRQDFTVFPYLFT